MKNNFLIYCLITIITFSGCNADRSDLVNNIIGNVSFVEKFGFEPDENSDNALRVITHLEYVERLLRKRDVSHLDKDLRTRRSRLLDFLRDYTKAGKFPKNYDHVNERKSCFIDKDKNICAVGYLVEKTAGRAVAETINASHQYASIVDMDGQMIDRWIKGSGLTKEECAMIQPTYNYYNVRPGYAISSAVIMGANTTFNVINIIDISKGSSSKTAPVLGLLAGTSQIAMGAFGYSKETDYNKYRSEPTVTSQGRLSLFNIGIGTSTVLLSSWNLLKQKKASAQRTSWNVFSFPDGGQAGVGMSFRRTI
ncbi:hypothetical protein L0663_21815 [Dyadobacter sp. CY107]|uniref:hypothetical protein n=1 Tax=Dyadobacter fanqingshengii TaxID=2906443 RepID=UPI001F18657F|nr:hypothetical protein [Dyadobacter fanqingshengii]MCF2506049.1 hypothetical protein [Dyadobacter fanqingshengii]